MRNYFPPASRTSLKKALIGYPIITILTVNLHFVMEYNNDRSHTPTSEIITSADVSYF